MKRIVCLLAAMSLVFLLAGCGREEVKYDVVFITTEGVEEEFIYDDCLQCVREICAASGLSLNCITVASTGVTVDEAVENAVKEWQVRLAVVYGWQAPAGVTEYEGVRQIYVSHVPTSPSAPTVAELCFDALSCGYLTGYAAAASGYSHIGFIGSMDTEEVDMGLGLIQGFSRALELKEQDEGAQQFIRYWYAGDAEEIRLEAGYWYGTGTQMIFATNGEIRDAVVSVKEEAPCFDLTLGKDMYLPLFRDAVEASLKEDGSFAKYSDGSYAAQVTGLPACLERICSCPDSAYTAAFAELFGGFRRELKDYTWTDALRDPRYYRLTETVTLEFFG